MTKKILKKFLFLKNLLYNRNMRNIVEISYVASERFAGWQKQKNAQSYQGVLEDAIRNVLGVEVGLVASGRTDAGVSAIKQVAHFDYDGHMDKNFVGHINSILPAEIRVLDVRPVKDDFHARFSAKRKTYQYCFYVSKVTLPYYERFATQVKYPLDDEVLCEQVKQLIGKHDFTSFCASGSSVTDFVREIYDARIIKSGDMYTFSITGNGFLYNMVRIIVGTLIDISRGAICLDVGEIILKKDRKFAGKTASAKGLVLKNVEYNDL